MSLANPSVLDPPQVPAPADTSAGADDGRRETIIRPQTGWAGIEWGELYRYRELLYFFVWRDIKIRYKQTVLGIAWGLLQPLVMMLIFTFIFGRLASVPSEGVPYPLFVFAGLLPWMLFSNGLSQGSLSLINQQNMISKTYMPRIMIPTAAVGVFLVDLMASFALYAVIMAFYGFAPRLSMLAVPLLIVLTVMLTLGSSYILAALTVLYRDFRYIVPFLVQILMYVSPVIYPPSMLPPRLQPFLSLNPLVGIIEGFRSAILGTPWNWPALATSVVISLVLFVFGLAYFHKVERRFADIA